MKIFAIISVVLMIILGGAIVYLSPNRSANRPDTTEGSAIYKARQEALIRSTQEATDAFSKLSPADRMKQATPAPLGSPASKDSATPLPAATPAP